jgi:hypothetical protein
MRQGRRGCPCSAPGSGEQELLERHHGAYSAAREKVLFDVWPGILGLAAEALLFAAMSAPRRYRTA